MRKRKGQSTLEHVALLCIIIGAFVTVGPYFKRAIQGKWRESADDLGDQYDPRFAITNITHRLRANSVSQVIAHNATTGDGYWTVRYDQTNSIETKEGFSRVGNP